ncbi:MAG: OLD family endonuclease [Firmicutes bacterium HGW-Firmicutes-1]|jgi:predicted ATPase|nr:MAG: OLD family endonuclease [Firmicutes bacterium HGW-Firmicutes-1]
MKITTLQIKNFKSIEEMTITDIENTLILVGKNNTGKSSILSAIRAMSSQYVISPFDFNQRNKNIEINLTLELSNEDLIELHHLRKISKLKNYDKWLEDFTKKIPSFADQSVYIGCKIHTDGSKKYYDGIQNNNAYIQELIPSLYIVDEGRSFDLLNDTFLDLQNFTDLDEVKNNLCQFDKGKKCNDCFNCIPLINRKSPEALTLYESLLLVKHKLYSANIKKYEDGINKYFQKSYGEQYEIHYKFNFDISQMLKINTVAKSLNNPHQVPIQQASTSMKSLYILSLFQAYLDVESKVSSIILVDQPELHLHPELQKITSEILYKLSKKNQVIFTTHSPSMLFNFSAKQIKQVLLNQNHHTTINETTNLDVILEDLGYNANDLMNVNFAFIVEGKDDRNRLPLILDQYYSEIRDEQDNLNRIAIIPTNSCTNIRTYANLKYINQTYLKDNFLMIRDSDGKDPNFLTEQLCSYYFKRMHDDDAKIPRITPRNVLILKYYSFENYFLNPTIMTQLGIISKEEDFYTILFSRYQQYIFNLRSAKIMVEKTGVKISTIEDLKNNMETIKIYIRGHNLFDIFYGRYKSREEQNRILKEYIKIAPREEFKDILDTIDSFVYFENRKK